MPFLCASRFIRSLISKGHLAYPNDKIYLLLQASMRVSKIDFLDCMEFADPDHVIVKTYGEKGCIGTKRDELGFLERICQRYPGKCSLRLDLACYVYKPQQPGIILVRCRKGFTNPL